MKETANRVAVLMLMLAGAMWSAAATPHAVAQSSRAQDPSQAEQDEPERVRNTDTWNLKKKTRLAIEGYDPVTYFPEGGGEPTKGRKEFEIEHKGAVYRFVSAANRDRFLDDPDRYEPAYGGWCAWAMREGDKIDINPKSFLIQHDRLLLFYDGWLGDTRKKWLKGDTDSLETMSDEEWQAISGESPPPAQSAEGEQPEANDH